MAAGASTIHASAVLIAARSFGAKAVLIRGPSGAGKSCLALALIEAARNGALLVARLVTDDRAFLEACNGRLVVRAPAELAGLLEVRGLGVRRLPCEPLAVVGLVVDLAASADRMPAAAEQQMTLQEVDLRRLAIAEGVDPLPLVLAAVGLADGGI